MRKGLRIAFVEAGHFHAGMFLDAVAGSEHSIAGVSDASDGAFLERAAAKYKCPSYSDYRVMLDRERPDFVFSFGRHSEMAGLVKDILLRGIPVCTEKPVCDDPAKMRELASLANDGGVFTDVALPLRFSPILAAFNAFNAGHDVGKVVHCYFRNMAGPVRRYVDWGNAWMLDKAQALGGPFMNEGAHYIDLFFQLAGGPASSVKGFMDNGIYGGSIDDNTTVVMGNGSGARCVIEICYGFPTAKNWRDLACVINTENYLFTLLDRESPRESALEIRSRKDGFVELVDLLAMPQNVYGLFIEESLRRFIDGRRGVVPFEYYCDVVDVLAGAYGRG